MRAVAKAAANAIATAAATAVAVAMATARDGCVGGLAVAATGGNKDDLGRRTTTAQHAHNGCVEGNCVGDAAAAAVTAALTMAVKVEVM